MKIKFISAALLGTAALVFTSCEKESQATEELNMENQALLFSTNFGSIAGKDFKARVAEKEALLQAQGNFAKGGDHDEDDARTITSTQFSEINAQLADQNIALVKADVIRSDEFSIEIVDSQFELQLNQHFVPNNPRNGDDLTITYNSFPGLNIANGTIPTDAISDDAYQRWSNDTFCGSTVQTTIVREANNGSWNSVLLNLGGEPGTPVSDVNIVGHLPDFVFTDIAGFPASTLGVAFSFAWLDDNGNPTDIDEDGFADSAFVEIWYNDSFSWTTDTNTNPNSIDLASVITHEQGHSLGLGHVGDLVVERDANGNVTFAEYFPYAVMNARYIGGSRSELGITDQTGYCANYNDWLEFGF